MAIVSGYNFNLPGFVPTSHSRVQAFASLLIDAAGEKAACVIQAPKSGNISHVHFRTGAVGTAGNADVRMETVGADGNPTGTLVGTNTNATQAISAANTWHRVALTAAAAVTRTQDIALVISNTTGAYNISAMDATVLAGGFPYGDHFTSATWNKQGVTVAMMLEYDDTTYPFIPGVYPLSTIATISVNTGSTPDEVGARFTAPPVACRTEGVWIYLDADAEGEIHLYNAAGTSIASVLTVVDRDFRPATNGGLYYYQFGTAQTLDASGDYRIALVPTTTTNLLLTYYETNADGYMTAMPGGTNWRFTSRTDAGAWSEIANRYPLFGLVITGIDSPQPGGPGRIWSPVSGVGRIAA